MKDSEIKKLHVITSAIEGKITVTAAAKTLNLSERRIKQLKKEVKELGAESVIHGNRGRKPAHAIDDNLAQHLIELKNSYNYREANFLHFKDLLEEHENIRISYSSLYKILTSSKIKSPKKHRKTKVHRRRKRKVAAGMMLQADGSPHDWFGDKNKCSLHGFIDDATGSITGLYMCEHECLLGYLEVLRQTLNNFGTPLSLYPDKYSVFFPSQKSKGTLTIEEQLEGIDKSVTQFGRIMDELGVEMFPASTAQAKGRIERLWETLQSRLFTEFRIRNIKTMEQANAFLPSYIKKYNKKFAVSPEEANSVFLQLPPNVDLDKLLCVKIRRKTDNSGVFSICNCKFSVMGDIPPKVPVTVLISKDSGIRVLYKEKIYSVAEMDFLQNSQNIKPGRLLSKVAQQLIHEYLLKNAKAA